MSSNVKSAGLSPSDSADGGATVLGGRRPNLRPEVIEPFRTATGQLASTPQKKPVELTGARSPAAYAWEVADLLGRMAATGLVGASAMIWVRCALLTNSTIAWLGVVVCSGLVVACVRRLMAFFQNGTTT